MADIRSYLSAVAQAVRTEDSGTLASLLSVDREPELGPLLARIPASSLKGTIAAYFTGPSDDSRLASLEKVVGFHLAAVAGSLEASRLEAADFSAGSAKAHSPIPALESAFDAEHDALKEFISLVGESPTNWVVKPLHSLVQGSYSLGRRLEDALDARGQRDAATGRINALATTLRNAFSVTSNHRIPRDSPLSKKWGALYVVNVLFRMYFSLNQLRQCKFLTGAVESGAFPPLEPPPPSAQPPPPPSGPGSFRGFTGFPMSQLVTYRYYTGLLALYDEDYSRANVCLTYALEHCQASYTHNRRRILEALVPVRLLLGQLPSPALLAAHGLQRYAGIAEGVRTGNLSAFGAALAEHREVFIASGVYLLLERLQLYTYRTLFKRVAKHLGSTRIPLATLQAALVASATAPTSVSDDDPSSSSSSSSSAAAGAPQPPAPAAAYFMDIPEVECVVANLIAGKYIKGYLSHKPPFLVTGKDRPFRPLAEVLALQTSASGPGGAS